MRSRIPWRIVILALWAAGPGRADAHLVNSGFGPFYDGVAHLFVTPEDLLVVVALALVAGLRGRPFGRAVLWVLPLAWLAGILAGRVAAFPAALPWLSAALLVTLGGLVAADRKSPLAVIAGAALLCGLAQGAFNGAALAGVGAGALAALGIGGAVFVVVALIAGQVSTLGEAWGRIAVRVAGSWIAAIGLLMLGWAMRGGS
ncbi:MAG: HupE/UreJ family protein [Gemmataceae bacterium]